MKKSHQLIVLLIIYLLALGIRIYWLSHKNNVSSVDEIYSVTLAHTNGYMWMNHYEFNKEYSGKELKEISLCSDDSLIDALKDIFRLWRNNHDDHHTNLYFTFFRLSLTGLKTGNLNQIFFRGGILNLLFFTVSFVFFFLLVKLLFPDSKLLQFTATFCTFLSTATISNTLFMRPYQIQETMFIIFCYVFFKTIDLKKWVIDNNKLYINVKLVSFLSVITAFTLLSSYYAIIFIGLFGLYVIIINYRKCNYREINSYFIILCLGVLFAQAFYSQYFVGYISGRSQETARTLLGDISANILSSVKVAIILLHMHFFTYPVIIICGICLIYLLFHIFQKQRLHIKKEALIVFIVSLFYFVLVMLFAPYKILRYVMPVFPFFVFLPAMMINSIKKRIVSTIVMLLLCAAFLVNSLNPKNIDNLNQNDPLDVYYFSRDADVPVYVLNSHPGKYAYLVPFFNDEQKYYFVDKFDDINLKNYNELYIVVEATLEIPDSSLTKFEIKQEFRTNYFVYKKVKVISNEN